MNLHDSGKRVMETNDARSGETLASAVYERLLEDILNGSLEPGFKLRLQVLKAQYDVGNSPLREAHNQNIWKQNW